MVKHGAYGMGREPPSRQAEAVRPVAEAPTFPFHPVETGFYRSFRDSAEPPVQVIGVSAPTGYGKTVLLAAMCRHYETQGCDCIWLALDDRDMNAERILSRLEVALLPDASVVHAIEVVHRGHAPEDERIATLIAALDERRRSGRTVVLFIDNFNACGDTACKTLLDALVFHTAPGVHLVLSSTAALPFSQVQAKLEGRVSNVGYGELSLTGADIREMLGAELCARLGEDALAAVEQQTEGWPAAVRLMQIILSQSADPRAAVEQFSGADEDLADFLNRRVLQAFADQPRRFLLELALLRHFSVESAIEVTGDLRAGEYIRDLIQRNLFVIPLDRNQSEYRLHGLFREFLLGEGRSQISPQRRMEILSRAATWYEHAREWWSAAEYALDSGSTPLAVAVLERVAALFVRDRGDLGQYITWMERLNESGTTGGWESEMWYVWALTFYRRYAVAQKHLRRLLVRLERAGDTGLSAEHAQGLKRRLDLLGIAIDIYTDQLADAREHASAWLPRRAGDDPFNVATVACAAVLVLCVDHRFSDAQQNLRIARSSITQTDSDYGIAWVALISSLPWLYEGDYARAHEPLMAAIGRARQTLGESSGIVGTLSLVAAKVAVERGRDADARELLKAGVHRIETHGVLDTAAFGLDAALKLWDGGSGDSVELDRLRSYAAAYPPRLALMFACLLIRRLVRLGRVDEALAEASGAGIPLQGPSVRRVFNDIELNASTHELISAVQIDLEIARGRFTHAAGRIKREVKIARDAGCCGRLVELALDETVLSVSSHNVADAQRHLARAVRWAAKREYLRPFRDRQELVAGIVNNTRVKDWGFVVDDERQFFAKICEGLPVTNSALLEKLDELNLAVTLADSPTARELELLRLVEAGLTNQQLADKLLLSVATVKWHLYNLYAKLGVSNRAAALSRARALNLLVR